MMNVSEEDFLNLFKRQYNIPTSQPKEKIDLLRILRNREFGFLPNHPRRSNIFTSDNPNLFSQHFFKSLSLIQNLSCLSLLEEHQNSIQSVDFDYSGNFICSTGQDLKVAIWSVKDNCLQYIYSSGHRYKVSRAKWTCDNQSIVTCSDDNTVRISQLCPSAVTETRLLCTHQNSVKDIVLCEPNVVLSGGTDACVCQTDIRDNTNKMLVKIRKRNSSLPILSIDCNMNLKPYLFAVSGKGAIVRMYDRRFIKVPHSIYKAVEVSKCPKISIPCVQFCPNAKRLLVSYNIGVLTIFDTTGESSEKQLVGHQCRPIQSKCAWFGDSYVFCTSCDGYIYAWDTDIGNVVYFQKADYADNVNSIAIHPNEPLVVTGGSDCRIKVWTPLEMNSFDYGYVQKKVITNLREKLVFDYYRQFLEENEQLNFLTTIKSLFENSDDDDDSADDENEIDISGCITF